MPQRSWCWRWTTDARVGVRRSSEQRDVEPGVELERRPVVLHRAALHVGMCVAETRLEPAQQIPARIGAARAAAADAEHVDSTSHVELHGRTAVEPDLQVAIEPDP